MGRKRIFGFVLGLLLISTIAFAVDSNFKPGSEPDGFRGIKWGTDISTLPDMKYDRTIQNPYGGMQVYTRENDEFKIGGANLKSIEYSFWRGKFSGVTICTKGFGNWTCLRDAIFEKFGNRREEEPNDEHTEGYAWSGKITEILLVYYEEIPEGGLFWMHSKKISAQEEEYANQKAKEGAEKGF